jgi:hypothetical protein
MLQGWREKGRFRVFLDVCWIPGINVLHSYFANNVLFIHHVKKTNCDFAKQLDVMDALCLRQTEIPFVCAPTMVTTSDVSQCLSGVLSSL